MPARAALRWLDARGWLVLAGSEAGVEAVRAKALTIAAGDGPLVILATSGENEAVTRLLDDFESLGARSGFLLDVYVEDDESLRTQLGEAGIVVAGVEADPVRAQDALVGAPVEGIHQAWQRGALVLLEGASAMQAGSWLMPAAGQRMDGLAWVPGALVLPGVCDVAANPLARALLGMEHGAVAIGIGPQSALALGPEGELEIWGEQQVSIALGPAWQAG